MNKTELMLLVQTGGRPTMTLKEVADLLSISTATAENRCYTKTLPFKMFKVGSKWNAHVSDVAVYIEQQRSEVAA